MKPTVLPRLLSTGLLVLSALSVVRAETSVTMTAKIPFAFLVGEVKLPAGEYTIDEYSSGLVAFRTNADHLLKVTYPGKYEAGESPRLVFHRYDDQYFLYELSSSDGAARRIPVSKLEKEHIAKGTRAASERSLPQDVLVYLTLMTR